MFFWDKEDDNENEADKSVNNNEEKNEKADKEKADKEKTDKEKADKEKADKEKADKEKADKEKADKEKADKEKADKEKADKEKADKEKADKEKADKEKADKEKADKEKADKDDKSKNTESQDNIDDQNNPTYGFKPSRESSNERVKSGFISSLVKIIASPPIIVSTLSFTHIIRKLSIWYLMISVLLITIHYFISFLIIDLLVKDTKSESESYGSLDIENNPICSLLVDFFLILLKFITCLFYVDMLLELFYTAFDFRINSISSIPLKYTAMFIITLMLSILYAAYRSLDILTALVEYSLVSVGFIFTSILAYLKYSGGNSNLGNQLEEQDESKLSTIFLIFSFISFSYETTSCSVSLSNNSKSGLFLVSTVGLCILSIFFILFMYISNWLWNMKLSDILFQLVSSKSNLYISSSILGKISFILLLIYSIFGFILNVNILNNSVANIFSILIVISNIIGTFIFLIIIFILIFLVVWNEIGKFLWWSTMILYMTLPLYSMYPYISYLLSDKNSKKYTIISWILIGILSVFFVLSLFHFKIFSPSHFKF